MRFFWNATCSTASATDELSKPIAKSYSSAKALRELGWSHPSFAVIWPPIIRRERELMAGRSGFLNELRHQPVVAD
jgi:hypothetical protein